MVATRQWARGLFTLILLVMRKHQRRPWKWVLALAMVACSLGGSAAAPASSTPVVITFWHSQSSAYQPVLDELSERFHERYPYITVENSYRGNSAVLQQSIYASLVARDTPTMALLYESWIPPIAGEIVPLTDLLSAEEKNDILEGLRSSMRYAGDVISIPFSRSVQVLYYIEDLVPEPPKTWEEYFSLAQELTVDLDGDGQIDRYGTGFRPAARPEIFLVFLAQNGGSVLNEDGSVVTLGNAQGIEAAEFYASFAPYSLITSEYMSNHFDSVAMTIDTSAGYYYNARGASEEGLNIRTALLPRGESGMSLSEGLSICVFSKATQSEVDAAVLYLKFLLEGDNAAYWAVQRGYYLPPTYSGYESQSWLDYVATSHHAAVSSQQMMESFSAFLHPQYSDIHTILSTMCEKLMTGVIPAKDTIVVACQAISDLLGIPIETNDSPTASFTWQALSSSGTRLVVEPRANDLIEFDASGSSDPDGDIVTYSWDWSSNGHYDSTTSNPVIEHVFASSGSHRVTLRVVDNDGATATVAKTVSISAKQPPNAAFSLTPSSPSILDTVQFTDTSSDPDGTVSGWAWDFGDGSLSTERNPGHRFSEKGTFTIQLTVIDNDGLTDSTTQTLTVRNLLPDAQFSYAPEAVRMNQGLFFDAAASSDADGEIVEFTWDFNSDGETDAFGLLAEWIYTEPGTYAVQLTVTDDDGATASHEAIVTVAAVAEIIEPAEVWALVIGISDYQDPAVKDLAYARADAEAFTRWLLDANVNPDHIVLLLDEVGEWSELDGITSQFATLTKVRAGIDWLRRMARPDDLVFVFFAGHGYQGEDDDGDETDGVDEFLILYDAERDSLEATTLRDDEFGRFLDRVESDHVMVVFDSCHSGGQDRSLSGGARPLGDEFDIFNDFSLEGRLILAAAQEDQQALEDDGLGHGLFTYFLLEGLEGAADIDLDHQITADELYTYVSDEVERFARQEKGRQQIPEMTGRGEVGIVLSRTNRPPDVAFTVAPDVPYAYGMIAFEDASTDDTEVVAWTWDFGSGGTSTNEHPTHTYEVAGTYTVLLTVTDDEGETSTLEQEITIAPSGEVTVIAGDTIIISLGSANGIQVGDRFEVLRILELADGQTIEERKAMIEVAEILGVDRAACSVLEALRPIDPGDVVRCEE